MAAFFSSLDLVVNRLVTVVTTVGATSTRSVRTTLGDVPPSETVVTTTSNISSAVTTEPELVRTIQVRTSADNFRSSQNIFVNDSGTVSSVSRLDNFNRTQNIYVNDSGTISVDYGTSYNFTDTGSVFFNRQLGYSYTTIVAPVTDYEYQIYSTPGTYTFTVPSGVSDLAIFAVGGGGGGTQSTGGGWGGFGGYTNYANLSVTPGANYTVTVGAGGSPSLTVGNSGGDSSFRVPSSNLPIVYAPGGPGARALRWNTNFVQASITNLNQFVANVTATSPQAEAITYSVSSGSLPTGLTYNSTTGNLSYIRNPALTSVFNTTFDLRASTATQSITRSINFTIVPPPTQPSTIEVLIVAGGGGGGGRLNGANQTAAGGGGAGGLIASTANVTVGTLYNIVVGGGGSSQANNGSNSTLAGLTAIGGGRGGVISAMTASDAPQTGGSGGGGAPYINGTGAAGTAGQGNAGGNGFYIGSQNQERFGGGGGGGAGAVGGNASTNAVSREAGSAGAGGAGQEWPTGSGIYYAGGGAGGQSYYINNTIPQGGIGGGGNGANSWASSPTYDGSSGQANTGGGGGGGAQGSSTLGFGGNGGSGVVIIRYLDIFTPAVSTTGNPVYTVANGYRVYRFTSSGSITF